MRAALLTVLLAATAAAGTVSYDAGAPPPSGALYSADGYHYAYPESVDGEDRWIVDGKARARGAPGAFAGPGALSADGAVLLHALACGGGKVCAALNGRRAGPPFDELALLTLSPKGGNAAYAGKSAQGWSVVSAQGQGPAFAGPPLVLAVSESHTAYLAPWGAQVWLYRDHKPVSIHSYERAAISPDLSRVAGVWTIPDTHRTYAEVDGKTFGAVRSAQTPVFSPNGRHWGLLAARAAAGHVDTLVIDGQPSKMESCGNCELVLDDAGRAFIDHVQVVVDEKTQVHFFYLDGKPLGLAGKVGLLPGGGHFVYPMLSGKQGPVIGLDGRVLEAGAPMLVPVAPPVFDGRDEYHYWSISGRRWVLVCGTVDGSDPEKTRCAEKARRLHGGKPPPPPPETRPAD